MLVGSAPSNQYEEILGIDGYEEVKRLVIARFPRARLSVNGAYVKAWKVNRFYVAETWKSSFNRGQWILLLYRRKI